MVEHGLSSFVVKCVFEIGCTLFVRHDHTESFTSIAGSKSVNRCLKMFLMRIAFNFSV